MEGSKIKAIQPTYPGVYIEESFNLSLSVSADATAVPVFAHNQGLIKSACPVKVDSWRSFMELDDVKLAKDNMLSYPLSVSLKAYFENGGGPCYLLSSDHLAAEVPKLEDVTLIVAAGENLIAQGIFSDNGGLCSEGRSLFAILDGPSGELNPDPHASLGSYPVTPNAAVYYPYLRADWTNVTIPPSAAVAGAYCRTDRERGVWKAPANVALRGGVTVQSKVSDEIHGIYNNTGLNMIREFAGQGTLIWGARTLDMSSDWRYIPVRRLFNSAERDISRSMKAMVFEPNSQPTWEKARSAIDSYLHRLWQQGALMGNTPAEAYFVQSGKGITMTSDDIAQGKMIVKIGMAAVRPAEFIILQFTQEVGQA